jgi:hypothetical protein
MRSLILMAVVASPALAETPNFTDETASAGIVHSYDGDWEYMVGGGVASFDCNNDRAPDLVMAGGTSPAALFVNQSPRGGALAFAKTAAGIEDVAVTGFYPLDIDNDGISDLVMLKVGANKVLKGLGNCQFSDASADWGFDGGDAWSTAFAATWEKGAVWPTLAIGNYVDRKEEAFPWGSCTDNWLHRGGDKGFAAPVALKPSFCALSMLFTDWNLSGTPSLRVSNDREYYKGGTEQMWHVEAGAEPRLYSADEGWRPLKIWGMGIASSDVNGDGYPDYFLTSMADNKLQVLTAQEGEKKPQFDDVAFKRGVTAHRPFVGDDLNPSTAWHAQFADVNNDGFDDLFIAKGNVSAMPDFAMKDPNNLLLGAADGIFVEVADKAGVASVGQARGAIVDDFNLDGWPDLAVVNRNGLAEIWRNNGGPGHWLMLRLAQEGANRDAIGAWVELKLGERVIRREVTSGGGHVSGSLGWLHLGLGAAEKAEVRVIWPDGTEGEWQELTAGQFYDLPQKAAAVVWTP